MELVWDDENEEHIARHRVSIWEVESLLSHHCHFRRHRGRFLGYGQTADGRYLMVVLEALGMGTWRPVTARDMTQTERRLLQRHI